MTRLDDMLEQGLEQARRWGDVYDVLFPGTAEPYVPDAEQRDDEPSEYERCVIDLLTRERR